MYETKKFGTYSTNFHKWNKTINIIDNENFTKIRFFKFIIVT